MLLDIYFGTIQAIFQEWNFYHPLKTSYHMIEWVDPMTTGFLSRLNSMFIGS